jgi:hypothetical protein
LLLLLSFLPGPHVPCPHMSSADPPLPRYQLLVTEAVCRHALVWVWWESGVGVGVGVVRCGVVWCGAVWCGAVWCGVCVCVGGGG